MQEYCPHYSKIAHCTEGERHLMVRLRCKRWSCDYCAEKNARIWQYRSIEHIGNSGEQWSFVTLTPRGTDLRRAGTDLSASERDRNSLATLRRGWDKLRKRMHRQVDKLQYLRVFERFEKGGFHMHLLVNIHWTDIRTRKDGTTYSRWLKENAVDCSLGYMTHASNLTDKRKAIAYCTKYLVKDVLANTEGLGRVRRIVTTQGWHDLKKGEAEVEWRTADAISKGLFLISSKVWFDLDLKRKISKADFDNPSSSYPYEAPPSAPHPAPTNE